jgi:hypothetical protein
VVGTVLALLLAACGGGGTDTTSTFRAQTAEWQELDAQCHAEPGVSHPGAAQCGPANDLREQLGVAIMQEVFDAFRNGDVDRLEELWSGDGEAAVAFELDGRHEITNIGTPDCDDFRSVSSIGCRVRFTRDGTPGWSALVRFEFHESGSLLFTAAGVLSTGGPG